MILHIEGQQAERRQVAESLAAAGHSVIESATALNGIQQAAETKPDLIVLGDALPDGGSFDVLSRLRDDPETADIPILQISSALASGPENATTPEAEADVFLLKPIDPRTLRAVTRSLLRRRRAEEDVRKIFMEWTSTFDAIQDGIALLDCQGNIVKANRRYSAIREKFTIPYDSIFPRLQATSRRQALEHSSGDLVFQIHLDPVVDPDGTLRGAVCTVADVTDKKKFDERLQHAQKLESIGVLAGGIAHDFNNLLTGILGNASLLQEELPSHGPSFEMAKEIVKASESAADLTRQLLAYAGKGRFVMQHLNLSEQIANSKTFLNRIIPHGVHLDFQLAQGLPALEADGSQLQQIVMNLVINAAESFGERGKGTVIVKTAAEAIDGHREIAPGRYVTLTVSDTGSGMTPEVRARIFDPFFTTKFTGRGLGLSAVHGIIRAHHGHLDLDTTPGEGSTFKLYLPAASEQVAVPTGAAADTNLSSGQGAVLVIDDEDTVRNFAETALTKMGYRVLLAENGQDGLDIIVNQGETLAAVLLDFAMPVMDGEEALERIRTIAPDLPVILSTGFNVTSELDRLTKKGATAFLPKPYTASQLSHMLYTI